MVKIFKNTEGSIIHSEGVIEAGKTASVSQETADLLIRLYPDELHIEAETIEPIAEPEVEVTKPTKNK